MKNLRPDARVRSTRGPVVFGLLAASWIALGWLPGAEAFESGRADFAVTINDELVVPYRVFAVYVLPGERLELSAEATAVSAEGGALVTVGEQRWSWTAPAEPGVAVIALRGASDAIRLNVLIMHPATEIEDGRLLGYQIGTYPEPLDGNPVYTAPDGFFALVPELDQIELSPHFRLGQFPSKQSPSFPKYLVLREALLLKLELLLERVNEVGIEAETFTVMSGFRTPSYNQAIGNGRHSRHVYGGAADIYIDVAPRDDVMDDLNRDGALDHRDAQWLYALADELFGSEAHRGLRGGLGVYRATASHGPFLHVDARGRRARWGLLP